MISRLLGNPYLLTGAIIARALASAGSVLWGVIVLGQTNALAWNAYKPLTNIAHEDVFASSLVVVGVVNLYRLGTHSKPYWAWSSFYAALAMWWLYTLILLLLASPPFPPTAITGVVMLAALSCIAFISNPKKDGSRTAVE